MASIIFKNSHPINVHLHLVSIADYVNTKDGTALGLQGRIRPGDPAHIGRGRQPKPRQKHFHLINLDLPQLGVF